MQGGRLSAATPCRPDASKLGANYCGAYGWLMKTLRLSAKIGIVIALLMLALGIAFSAVVLREHLTQGPDALASSGMYAFGDLVLGVAVFWVLALLPASLTLYWLRPVARFWSVLALSALLFALTGVAAVAANAWASDATNHWLLLAQARVGVMPLTALAAVACACFAPQLRHRWLLVGIGLTEAVLFTATFLKLLLRTVGT
jgi:hypothetical protein